MFNHSLFNALFGETVVPARFDRSAAIDAYRRGETLFIHVDLPGVAPESIEVGKDGDWLSITGERHYAPEVTDQVLVTERPFGKFNRRILVDERLDLSDAIAELADGVLTLQIPVAAKSKAEKIQVKINRRPEQR
jgi:HSP20 family protein